MKPYVICQMMSSVVYVEGKLRTHSFENANGSQGWGTEVKTTRIQFLDPHSDDADGADEVAEDDAA